MLLVTPLVFGDASAPRTPAGVLAPPVAVWLGAVSYGFFLWHLPLTGWTIGNLGDTPLVVIGASAAVGGRPTECA